MRPADPGLVALVTGAASGIGAASARTLHAAGVSVVVADVDASGLQATAAALHLDSCLPVVADLSTASGARSAVAAATDRWGRLDLLHLNAGRPGVGPLDENTDLDGVSAALTANVLSAVGPFVAALPHLRRSPSAAVTVTASLAGLVGSPADPVYAASKHALVGLVRSLAPAHPGVRVNAVCPSLVATPMVVGTGAAPLPPDLPLLHSDDVAAAVRDQLLGGVDGIDGQVLFLEAGTPPVVVPESRISLLQG